MMYLTTNIGVDIEHVGRISRERTSKDPSVPLNSYGALNKDVFIVNGSYLNI